MFLRVVKLFLASYLLFFLLGYQPSLAIPPIKRSVAQADFSIEQSIDSSKLTEPFQLPHLGYISTYFSSYHPGIDIAIGLGMPVHPIASGKVSEVSSGFWGLGHTVVVKHAQDFQSTYGHLGRIFVKPGNQVTATSILGEVGMSGNTSGPHTHLEITKEGKYLDPLSLLPTLPDIKSSGN